MKGIVFNLLEEVVTRHHGQDTWDALLEAAGVDGAYTSLGSYADNEIQNLLVAAARNRNTTPDEVLRWFGREAMPLLAERYPAFFERQRSLRPFILGLNNVIHAEVRKLYPGASCPHFQFDDDSQGRLLMAYRSPRRMCALAEGFVEGAAAHFRETVRFEHLQCMHQGDPNCLFRLSFA